VVERKKNTLPSSNDFVYLNPCDKRDRPRSKNPKANATHLLACVLIGFDLTSTPNTTKSAPPHLHRNTTKNNGKTKNIKRYRRSPI